MKTKLSPEMVSLLEVQSASFVLIDADYQIVGANQAYCENYGISQLEIVGKRCYEVSHRSDVPCHEHGEDCPHQAVFSTAKPHEVIHTHFDRHHRPEYARIKGHPIMGEAGVRYLGELIIPIANPDELNCDEMRMVGHSPAFLHCVEMLARVAESEASVLLLGESGVGKELAAQYLHKRSSRHDKPFVAINCAAITETMFEDELFGHERGAFTGCIGLKQGLFELAHGGTLFLDEAGEIPLTMQAKLLRVLETGEYRRMGGTGTLTADVRIVAATNRNLLDMAESGQYRLDLYYRIAGIDLRLPSLRERRIDIPALAETMLKRITEAGAPRCKLTDRALDKLMAYDFPGNVRELRNILLRAVAICNNSVIDAEQIVLGSSLSSMSSVTSIPTVPNSDAVQAMQRVVAGIPITQLEADYIAELLKIHHGHRRNVADILGMSERTLYRKLKQYGLS